MALDPPGDHGPRRPDDEPRPPEEARERAVYAFERYADSLLAHVTRLVQDRQDAEALVQEIFLRLVVERGSFASEGKLRAWLYLVAKNLALDHLKKRRAKPVDASLDLLLPTQSPRVALEDREVLEAMHRCLGELPQIYRTTLIMRYLEGQSYEEIAEIEGVSQSALRTRIQKGIELLREGLSGLLDGSRAQTRTSQPKKRSEAL